VRDTDTAAAGTPGTPRTDSRTSRTEPAESRAGRDPRSPETGADRGAQGETHKDLRSEDRAGKDLPSDRTGGDLRSEDRAGKDFRSEDRAGKGFRSGDRAGRGTGPGAPAAVETPQAKADPVVPDPNGPSGSHGSNGSKGPDRALGGSDEARTFGRRMDRAVHDFVEDPRRAVREADAVLDEVIGRVERTLQSRRQALRDGSAAGADTEALRVALTRYRDLAGRLLTFSE
jgi:hypothetical protein